MGWGKTSQPHVQTNRVGGWGKILAGHLLSKLNVGSGNTLVGHLQSKLHVGIGKATSEWETVQPQVQTNPAGG
ncbi:unnamed protein product [Prunus armeniaca]|uniref:Uncharacterized protein n=2 Tax=Prunus armeniaca TaxID=36596 RepID=A0A6J5THV7_PRUAR|nr:unnamed protein product [Prunus armeniaca]